MKIFADNIDITEAVGGLSWKNTVAELATTMDFEVAKTDAMYTNIYQPGCGSIIQMYTNEEVFRGIVVSIDDGSLSANKYKITDFGWYLNKSKETYQFNNISASEAIKRVCSDFNIQVAYMPDLNISITKIYLDKTISEIISDILSVCGGNYNYDMVPSGIRIYPLGEFIAYPKFRLSPNTQLVDSAMLRGNVSHSESIEDMKNSIKVITATDDTYTVQKIAKNDELIKKYGLLQEVIKIDLTKENPDAVAMTKLMELSKTAESFSFEIIEDMDNYTRAGAVIYLGDINFLIEGSSHNVKNEIHTVKLDLKRF